MDKFNPKKHLISLKGKMYLETKFRLIWFRTEHPRGCVSTNVECYDPLTVKATIYDGEGAVLATGYASANDKGNAVWSGRAIEKAECLDLDAEMLTQRGFRPFYDLREGEAVLAYDKETDTCVWTPLRAVSVYGSAPVVRLASKWFDVLMTPNHSWAVKAQTGERSLVEGHQLQPNQRLILSAPAPGGDSPITPNEAALIGWLFTDGSVRWTGNSVRGIVYQSKPEHIEAIRALMPPAAREAVRIGGSHTFPTGRTYATLDQRQFLLSAADTRALLDKALIRTSEDLPSLATRLSVEARHAMYTAFMAADGDGRGYFGKKRKPGVQECWQILCTLNGVAVGAYRNKDVFPVQRAKKRRFACVSELSLQDAGTAPVWCPTTDYGTWITRLPNGQVTITGNTAAIGRALAHAGYGTQFAGNEIDDTDHLADSPVERKSPTNSNSKPETALGQNGQKRVRDMPYIFSKVRHLYGEDEAAAKEHFRHGTLKKLEKSGAIQAAMTDDEVVAAVVAYKKQQQMDADFDSLTAVPVNGVKAG